ncbi:SseB family protein [Leptospira perdikensis]|uniref:SseB family protein n=1 Tax=Leptospira perdikensis TaxID=2484948 RepID=A0A4R9JJM2_9LEPT|nr:SseB family protein [Leptospira perdikensis]TGL45183.1 SseB family protein [Leptospira perdikensis]
MGLFNKIFKKKLDYQPPIQNNAAKLLENHDGISLLDKHEKGLLDDKSFLSSFGKVKVFYSTPFGDHKDGSSRLFVLPAPDKTAYLPVFTSTERAMEFYNEAGRLGFLLMEDSFVSFLETTKKINEGNTPIKLGAVIDPGYYGVTVNANVLDTVIDMTK